MYAAVIPLLLATGAPVLMGRGNSGWVGLLPVAVIIALVVAAAYFGYLREKKRTEALRQTAEEMQFDFTAKDDAGLLSSLTPGNFHLFAQGSSKKCYNILRGQASDLEVIIFDYRYTTGSGKSSHTWAQTVLAFRRPGLDLPAFSLRPLNFWHKVGHLFGYQDITFDEHPAFSSRYLLRGPNEAAVRQVFTEDVLSWYEGTEGLSTEARGDRLLFYRHNKRVDPQTIRPFLEEGFKVLALFNPPGDAAETGPESGAQQ